MNTFIVKHEGKEVAVEIYEPKQVTELRSRLRTGNEKLNKAWDEMTKTTYSQEMWQEVLDDWHMANVKLSYLCDQLIAFGDRTCLYDWRKDCLEGICCRVCPVSEAEWEKRRSQVKLL